MGERAPARRIGINAALKCIFARIRVRGGNRLRISCSRRKTDGSLFGRRELPIFGEAAMTLPRGPRQRGEPC